VPGPDADAGADADGGAAGHNARRLPGRDDPGRQRGAGVQHRAVGELTGRDA
jgi:hypothetical protein